MIKLIAALGNPGPEYMSSRHNAGWQMVEYLSFFKDLSWQEKFNASYSDTMVGNRKMHIVLPRTFMNRSGGSVAAASVFFKIRPDEILVIHDDLELEFGLIGFKYGGGLGGHNGLRSVTSSLGTKDFNRFRIGISRPVHKDVTSYVLGSFSNEEQKELPFLLGAAASTLEENIDRDIQETGIELRKIRVIGD